MHKILFYNTYLLTYSTVQSPSCAANWFPTSQEIPRISRNPKVHYRTHKPPPPVSIQYVYYNASTCFEHYCARHQDVKIVLYSSWYRHTL